MKYLIPIVFLFCSCRTVNKLFHKDKEHIDSAVHEKVDTVSVHKVDSTVIINHSDSSKKESSSDYSREIEIDFDSSKTIYTSFINAKDFLNLPHITRIKVRETGHQNYIEQSWDKILDSFHKLEVDSNAKKQIKNTDLKKQVTVISKSVEKKVDFTTVIYWIIGILLLLVLLYLIYRYRKFIFSFLKIPPL